MTLQHTVSAVPVENAVSRMVVSHLFVRYGDKIALSDVSLDIKGPGITALIGPSGCGKSTFLRCLNRMNETIPGSRVTGRVQLDGQDIYAANVDAVAVRRHVGMVFQKPNPFPKSIFENIAFGLRLHGLAPNRAALEAAVSDSLLRAGLWAEVKDRLNQNATTLSGGQQQRLCIARAIAIQPSVLLMDEPCSALDPNATEVVEHLISELALKLPVVMVTHHLAQARRMANWVAYFHMGKCLENGTAEAVFEHPQNPTLRDYIRGRFG